MSQNLSGSNSSCAGRSNGATTRCGGGWLLLPLPLPFPTGSDRTALAGGIAIAGGGKVITEADGEANKGSGSSSSATDVNSDRDGCGRGLAHIVASFFRAGVLSEADEVDFVEACGFGDGFEDDFGDGSAGGKRKSPQGGVAVGLSDFVGVAEAGCVIVGTRVGSGVIGADDPEGSSGDGSGVIGGVDRSFPLPGLGCRFGDM